jgi:hypothetical protein
MVVRYRVLQKAIESCQAGRNQFAQYHVSAYRDFPTRRYKVKMREIPPVREAMTSSTMDYAGACSLRPIP